MGFQRFIDKFIDKEFLFYGVDVFRAMIKLDDFILEVEAGNESSTGTYFKDVTVLSDRDKKLKRWFAKDPIAIVKFKKDDRVEDGFVLEDVEIDHTWVLFGTTESDALELQSFYMNYRPLNKETAKRMPSRTIKTICNSDLLDMLFEEREI